MYEQCEKFVKVMVSWCGVGKTVINMWEEAIIMQVPIEWMPFEIFKKSSVNIFFRNLQYPLVQISGTSVWHSSISLHNAMLEVGHYHSLALNGDKLKLRDCWGIWYAHNVYAGLLESWQLTDTCMHRRMWTVSRTLLYVDVLPNYSKIKILNVKRTKA